MRVKDFTPNMAWFLKNKGIGTYVGGGNFVFVNLPAHTHKHFSSDTDVGVGGIPIFFFPKELV